MTTRSGDPTGVFGKLGVTPIIHASGSVTRYGGTRTRPEVLEVMSEAARVLVDMEELNNKAGEVIARLTGAEAGFVCSGAAGGLVLQAAACIAGSDQFKMHRLPDSEGMKNEVIIQNNHRFHYDQAYRAAGGKLIGIGHGKGCSAWELEGAINEHTAAVAYLIAPFTNRRALSLEEVCRIAHKHDVPVIVDGASTLPPRRNLRRFLEGGADMVVFSGGKGVRGPQGAGILCGRKDLIEAAAFNASPNQALGRPMKVSKEEIVGLITALERFVEEDEEQEMADYRGKAQHVVDALAEVPGLEISLEHDDFDYLIPTAVMRFGRDWRGPPRDQIAQAMEKGTPPIYLHQMGEPDELAVDPLNLLDDEVEIVIRRLREELLRP
ncbi:MAG TPA: aminotransferase class V-fold PLP-dependent enzyme [Dehalococcoidia bacterium]|nr:aminotransferase class V-fold PLP-dependent enzyme [Dehalococcoidia bacterium]